MRYFISGHRDITFIEFVYNYTPLIDSTIKGDPKATFVVGDCVGVDSMSQQYLKVQYPDSKVTVYHIGSEPMNSNGYPTKGNFDSDYQRDFNMTLNSDFDITWIRPGKERSGTMMNLKRRKWYNERTSKGLSTNISDVIAHDALEFL